MRWRRMRRMMWMHWYRHYLFTNAHTCDERRCDEEPQAKPVQERGESIKCIRAQMRCTCGMRRPSTLPQTLSGPSSTSARREKTYQFLPSRHVSRALCLAHDERPPNAPRPQSRSDAQLPPHHLGEAHTERAQTKIEWANGRA